MGTTVLCVVAVLGMCAMASAATPQLVYAGYEHMLVVDSDNMTVSAFDYRRHLPFYSTCDAFVQPPLLKDVVLGDWLSNISLSYESSTDLTFTHVGYEVFLVEHKVTGYYMTRRCRDFRPQLTELPCEPLGTGRSDLLAAPYRTIFIGNARVMILNTDTGDFTIHTVDVDVHSSGDPFRFSHGPIVSAKFPFRDGLKESNFAYVQLPSHRGDLLLIQKPEGIVQAWKFNGAARDEIDWYMKFAFMRPAPEGLKMTAMGENQVIFYSNDVQYTVWDMDMDAEGKEFAVTQDIARGAVNKGINCDFDNATKCVSTDGCAWCPSTYSCMDYDRVNGHFCDQNACQAPPLVDKILAGQAVVIPDCVSEVPVDATHAEMFDTIDEGFAKLPGNMRLDPEYRNDANSHLNDAGPIHPAIDNQLFDDAIEVGDNADDAIHNANQVAQGTVPTVPASSEIMPCMNNGYDESKGVEVPQADKTEAGMNLPPSDVVPPTFTMSPVGDAETATESEECTRKGNSTGSAHVKFSPPQVASAVNTEVYQPATTATHFEQDLMNDDPTNFSDMKGQMGVDAAERPSNVLAPLRVAETESFKPRDTARKHNSKLVESALQPVLRTQGLTDSEMMNGGLPTDGLLANPDCTEDGGNDGLASASFSSAMQNSESASAFPETLEAQLNLFKDEPKKTEDFGTVGQQQVFEEMQKPMPVAADEFQPEERVVASRDTVVSGVSAQEEGERVDVKRS